MDFLELAKNLAIEAGKVQVKHLRDAHTIEKKDSVNLVTEVDRKCERLISEGIQAKFPDHDILGEEGESARKDSSYRWIVDPLDGTTNYAHQFPFFDVSIALEHEGEIVCGVIYDPIRDELFAAREGSGAFLNDNKITVSQRELLCDSLLATGFAYVKRDLQKVENVNYFEEFIRRALAVRRPGAAALDLAYVACGRLDGFWEMNLKPWDMAAGKIIIEEAGGKVTSFDGSGFDLYGNQMLASNSLIHNEMTKVLSEDF